VAYATLIWATNSCCWHVAVLGRNMMYTWRYGKFKGRSCYCTKKFLMRLSSWKKKKKLEADKESLLAAADNDCEKAEQWS